MEKISTRLILILVLNTLLIGCKQASTEEEYLSIVLDNLLQIKNITYYSTSEAWVPLDTVPTHVYHRFRMEYDNPSDSTIGAIYVSMNQDKSKVETVYDGNMIATVFHEHKGVLIDSFKLKRNLDFRPTTPPFFNYAKSILRYALNTNDSIRLNYQDSDSSLYVKLTIMEENTIEFFGKAYRVPKYQYDEDNTSQYELWIDKNLNLPYRIRRKMSHDISVEECKIIEINKLDINKFVATDYYPEKYEIREYGVNSVKNKKSNLIGQKAFKWVLKDINNKKISLNELKSKILMLQFTSVSCGPCRVSIPYLNKLSLAYSKKKFDFVAIECTAQSSRALKFYKDKTNINYKFLQSSKEVMEKYSIKSFPVFIFLNKEREIIKVINGYKENKTDKEIESIINELI